MTEPFETFLEAAAAAREHPTRTLWRVRREQARRRGSTQADTTAKAAAEAKRERRRQRNLDAAARGRAD